MYELYRVIVCENPQKYPEQLFIDIYPALFATHEKLFKMRQLITPDLSEIIGGVYLQHRGGNDVSLQYIKHHNKLLQMQQERLRQRIDPMILKMFSEMQKRGIKQTIEASVSQAVEIFSWKACIGSYEARSAKEEQFLLRQKYIKERQEHCEQKKADYAQRKYAANPHILLQWKQAVYRGD